MTIQDLKEKRNEILSRIAEVSEIQHAKEIMETMVAFISRFEYDNVIDLVDEVVEIKDLKVYKGGDFVVDGVDYGTQADYQRACMGKKWN
jgi:hypothetical protein